MFGYTFRTLNWSKNSCFLKPETLIWFSHKTTLQRETTYTLKLISCVRRVQTDEWMGTRNSFRDQLITYLLTMYTDRLLTDLY